MINLGTIGTNWITERMLEAATTIGAYRLQAVYSRHSATAAQFAHDHAGQRSYTNLTDFFNDEQVDTVYIASPNSLHFQQILQALRHHKNVIVEKPAVLSPYQLQMILDEQARQPDLQVLEAARNVHMPAFKAVEQQLATWDHVEGAEFNFSQYSSRYGQVLAGELPNVFNRKFGGGVLTDLGIYPIYDAVALFGVPQQQFYYPTWIKTGVDGKGTARLEYDGFTVILNFSKISFSNQASEIYGGRQLITIDNAGEFTQADYFTGKEQQQLSPAYRDNPMIPEMTDFAALLEQPNTRIAKERGNRERQLMKQVNQVLDRLAASAGISYPQ
ncbi:Gfo/Idh/MocA family protein [Fructilactobacillus florum]|uniref:Gfo/Idh/MocA family protein n=1 Tax=Fructilactobacillus florum TaxID=640331 RepID=UPI00028DAF8B|nr:Gfo/Idh/MocA family oxidoreductase [Fructilactobacillus florum]EKK20073.1 putative dehydrogenase related protein [Fructilactobacillus florum 2F]